MKFKFSIKLLLSVFLLLISFSTYAQDDIFIKKRTLDFTPSVDKFEVQDTTINVDYHRDSTIRSLHKSWIFIENGDTIEVNERYSHKKRFKYWVVGQYKTHTIHSTSLDDLGYTVQYITESYIRHGKSYSYNSEGQIISIVEYENDVMTAIYTNFDYYLNGQLQRVIEYKSKDNSIYNVLDYRFPDGEKYTDYGDLKDGTGTIFFLNEDGGWCKPTVYLNGKRMKNK
jgi:hypothetical protein